MNITLTVKQLFDLGRFAIYRVRLYQILICIWISFETNIERGRYVLLLVRRSIYVGGKARIILKDPP